MPTDIQYDLELQRLRLTIRQAGVPPCVHDLPVGLEDMVVRFFPALPPTAYQMESAIAFVEDAVMPLARAIPQGARWWSESPALRPLLTDASTGTLDMDTLERRFNALADWTNGAPRTALGIPDDATWCAQLLVLRECMHHWSIETLELR